MQSSPQVIKLPHPAAPGPRGEIKRCRHHKVWLQLQTELCVSFSYGCETEQRTNIIVKVYRMLILDNLAHRSWTMTSILCHCEMPINQSGNLFSLLFGVCGIRRINSRNEVWWVPVCVDSITD